MTRLGDRLRPCGPVVDVRPAERLLDVLVSQHALSPSERQALAPVFGASPYLAGLVRRDPARLAGLLDSDPDVRLEDILDRTRALADVAPEVAAPGLRRLKAEAHLLTALADLGGVWNLDQVTGALTRFADAALASALASAAGAEVAAGRLRPSADPAAGPVPGFFCIAMGKHGAFELNYSSDIDISIFFEPEALPLAEGIEPQAFAVRLTHRLTELMQERTPEGYVFRIDLRLRPDPGSTPPAVSAAAALDYYESVGQNWERAAFIKARACAGDLPRAGAFLAELEPFIWRRNLDFGAIADIHSIKRQIHIHKVDDRLSARGADLKLGRGGIREIEFYVQTQQLILGGRQPSLRSFRTLEALAALAGAGHVSPQARDDLTEAYHHLRALEHRVQMLADEQTHRLPESDAERRRVAALSGHDRLRSFDAWVERILRSVNHRYGELFPGEEPLSSRFGSLIFTGVDDDPETLKTLARMGFSQPAQVSQTIRAWHHGHIAATRSERGRELFTRLAPRLLEAAHAAGAPDAAFLRFGAFFSRLSSGVQLQSLFLAQPALFELIVEVMAFAPRLADTLARRPAALDAMLDPAFFGTIDPAEDRQALQGAVAGAGDFEAAMDTVRRQHREQAFRVGVQVMSGSAGAEAAGRAFAGLADACIEALAPAALAEATRIGGAFDGQVAVVALGKCGSREMSAGSDLDLMTLHRAASPDALSALKGWPAEVFYARFTQRLVAALSLPTSEGELYEVDMRLRPSGAKGPVAVAFPTFGAYYETEAETWEFMALTRARVVWSSDPAFAADVNAAIESALRQPRDVVILSRDVREMRALIAQEKPASGVWDMKLAPGGLVDIEFAAQFLQLAHAPAGGPLRAGTADALEALAAAGLAGPVGPLLEAWTLQQNLTQMLRLALGDGDDPADQPEAFRRKLARAGGARDFRSLAARLARTRKNALEAFDRLVRP
ncbi:MAG: bifunctional [glutamine synthetase] adenylyltransferase/[glutamine synthetase]-adenylyl-L-tyrosine phosphorylase [Phenylobacterium sp.]|uniref:bifunctional [glutamine synthetase] adenylyltransferase/[glutamine synthetase]-adenylyl-L-tyrosine phosphorylase n=1 Tax=Phenylobacterium sp. TaxID=1871053 RepID=UPI0025EFF177|nr:bifunctional [glutamine synthetase] adenylyltransferase/[glutamine synthetase]-adenylyl-L-tyrosine phosphorylase [Phenylobacterium sp.]MCA3711944.1 bifunctional [glutamine synthetase] adenylyltransferase/[glutamine synthetase]-adenylyl-L-tyrosine phosphorylase [Phenylobacterium sp.]MCA3728392.1 bifunctional [glutamine synthetase] adenylyltransferase/[glutamine synthetase]-adenylyl-L-tyrosine phosphorylase [Phenylobacterium sp.]MCA3751238.1 bifunctional [glutamine synthetase] adenylyltransfera